MLTEWRTRPAFRKSSRATKLGPSFRIAKRSWNERDIEIPEFARVRLNARIDGPDGIVSLGSSGTIVYRYNGGEDYEVEFTHPIQTVITLRRTDFDLL